MNKLEKFNFAIQQQEGYLQQERDWEDEENKNKEKQNEQEQEDTPTPERTLQLDLRDYLDDNSNSTLIEEADTIKDNFRNGVYNDTEAEFQKERLVEIETITNENNKIEGENLENEIVQPLSNDNNQNEIHKIQNDEETKSNDIEKSR
jgi:hypothetical protein